MKEKEDFIKELGPACIDAQTALATPLLEVIRLALKETFKASMKKKTQREKKTRKLQERKEDEREDGIQEKPSIEGSEEKEGVMAIEARGEEGEGVRGRDEEEQ
ncbi:hypothetical protein CSUI_009686 [Cystoisospora suis]|uniref:Uncharacterized protein n=1 Tax=Cystoisospora suis TaxID=483139 RepID=A0A2C6KG38_9APIC|nr:hypothetical protein CSUI_009686 [Cystoisospora suis]